MQTFLFVSIYACIHGFLSVMCVYKFVCVYAQRGHLNISDACACMQSRGMSANFHLQTNHGRQNDILCYCHIGYIRPINGNMFHVLDKIPPMVLLSKRLMNKQMNRKTDRWFS